MQTASTSKVCSAPVGAQSGPASAIVAVRTRPSPGGAHDHVPPDDLAHLRAVLRVLDQPLGVRGHPRPDTHPSRAGGAGSARLLLPGRRVVRSLLGPGTSCTYRWLCRSRNRPDYYDDTRPRPMYRPVLRPLPPGPSESIGSIRHPVRATVVAPQPKKRPARRDYAPVLLFLRLVDVVMPGDLAQLDRSRRRPRRGSPRTPPPSCRAPPP